MAPIMQSIIAVAAFSSVAYSLPSGTDGWFNRWNQGRDSTPTLPLNEISNTGPTPLPQPQGTLKYIQLGLGFQNYSCSATTSTPSGAWIQTVYSAGAVADFYDITKNFNKYTGDTITKNTLKAFETCLKVTKCSPSVSNDYCDKCHSIAAAAFQPSLDGFHFFEPVNGAQSPNFAIYRQGDYLAAKKAGSAKALVSAYNGENNLGAVDWLYLVDNASGRTHGLKSVYRVQTAGGVAPSSCNKPGAQLQVPYAAEYWFYD